ncbi:DUF4396 domain-containing protein [Rhodococcus aerolatus]
MTMGSALPSWLTPLAWVFLTLAVVSAAAIGVDIYGRDHRRGTVATELVWIGSALYLGPLALAFYNRTTRAAADAATPSPGTEPRAAAGLAGGTASAAAHLVGVPLVVLSGLTIAGIDLWVMIIVIAVLATVLLVGYERASRRPGAVPVGTAVLVAVLTVLAFDVGMGGWMLVLHFNGLMPPATDAAFWFLMQVGIVLGLITGYPAVTWLARRTSRTTSAA